MTDNTPDYKDNLYFNSQNTKNEQQKDLCITSEQLTEQWKKGELPSGEYYIIDDLGLHTTDRYYPSHGFGTELPQSVLGRVPSYEEMQSMNEAVNQAMAANIKLVEENKQLKEQINHLLKTQARQFVDNQKLQVKVEKAKDVVNIDTARHIKQLKELLKDAKNVLKMVDTYYGDYDSTKGFLIVERIEEVLK